MVIRFDKKPARIFVAVISALLLVLFSCTSLQQFKENTGVEKYQLTKENLILITKRGNEIIIPREKIRSLVVKGDKILYNKEEYVVVKNLIMKIKDIIQNAKHDSEND